MCVQAFYFSRIFYRIRVSQLRESWHLYKASTYITSDEFLYEAEEIVWNYLWSRELNGLKKNNNNLAKFENQGGFYLGSRLIKTCEFHVAGGGEFVFQEGGK